MRVALLAVALLAFSPTSSVLADEFCDAPLSDWQPSQALQAKLEGQGWRGVDIRVEDGCYLVHAYNDQGERLHGKFDPVTIEPLPGGRRHRHRGAGDGSEAHPED
jgi:hypothetical protein